MVNPSVITKRGEQIEKHLERIRPFTSLSHDAFDIHVFQQMPIYVKQRVLRDGEVLFCRNEDMLYELAFAVIREYSDFEPVYRDYLKEVANAG